MNYFYREFYYRWFLRNHRNDGQIVKQETQFWKSNAQQWLTKLFTDRKSRKAEKEMAKLRQRANQLDAFLVTRDHNGVESPVALPILTPEEQIRINRGKRRHLFLIILLSAIDTFLFSLIAVYFIPSESGYGSRLIFGFIAALSIILCWEGGFAGILTYIKDRNLFKKGKLESMLVSYAKLTLGILLLIIAIGLSISIGIVRMHLLEGADSGVMEAVSTQAGENIRAAGSWASIASIIFAFLTGILLGFSRIMTDNYNEKGAMYNRYEAMSKDISKHRKEIDQYDKARKNNIKEHVESHWKMILYIRNVLRRDFDEEDRELAELLKTERRSKGFTYNEDAYHTFQDVQCMDEKLFKFGVFNSETCLHGQQLWEESMTEFKTITAHIDEMHKVNKERPKPAVSSYNGAIKTATAVIAIVVAMSFSSCKSPVHKPADVTAFVDDSNSLPKETLQFYLDFIRKMIVYLSPGDHLRVLPIDRNTESGSEELVDIVLPPASYFSSPFDPPAQKNQMIAIRTKRFQDSIIKVLEKGIIKLKERDEHLRQGTDIFGALRVGQSYYDPSKTNVLIICSDMLNYSPELHMEHVDINDRFIKRSLASLNDNYHNKNYFGIFCVTGPNSSLSPKVFDGSKLFWMTYFKKAGFTNTLYVSGQVSVIEDRLQAMRNQDTLVSQNIF